MVRFVRGEDIFEVRLWWEVTHRVYQSKATREEKRVVGLEVKDEGELVSCVRGSVLLQQAPERSTIKIVTWTG